MLAVLLFEFDSLSSKEHILGGIAVGATPLRMLRLYYLPFLYDKLIIYMITDMGKVMFLLGQVGFIGIFLSQKLQQIEDAPVFKLLNTSITWSSLFENAYSDIRGPVWIRFFRPWRLPIRFLNVIFLPKACKNY